jgi:hypothetical protein
MLTRPMLPRLPCLPPAEHRALLDACLEKVEADGHRYGVPLYVLAFAVPLAAVEAWRHATGARGFDVGQATVLCTALLASVTAAHWAYFLISARHMRPYLLAELYDRGL